MYGIQEVGTVVRGCVFYVGSVCVCVSSCRLREQTAIYPKKIVRTADSTWGC